jgi:misacylated tRNA(Ala) deacylase
MTRLLYYDDAYIREFDALVFKMSQNRVVLDQTAFYPGGGGQPHDVGWIMINDTKRAVVSMVRENQEIWHCLDEHSETVEQDAIVKGILDWDKRYALMRTHTAMHILCGVIWRDYGASVTGGNMEPGKGRMDFEFETMHRDLIDDIEQACNKEVRAARDVRTNIMPRDEALKIPDLIRTKVNLIPQAVKDIRTVEIIGLDLQADGGTHVANTQEVGQMRITDYKSKGAINKRIYLEINH